MTTPVISTYVFGLRRITQREPPIASVTTSLVMQVNATRFIRKMRGGSQAHLLACDDGQCYVVKFQNNPQHRRILINEWLGSALLNYLQISTPSPALVHLSPTFLSESPDIHIQLHGRHFPVESGRHFGSRYPGDPNEMKVYDFLPDLMIEKITNVNEFLGVLAFDKWTGNADARQAIFFRPRIQHWTAKCRHRSSGFIAHMLDHGFTFGGMHWTFSDSPLQGLYFRGVVYQKVKSLEDFQPWLDRIVNLPREVLIEIIKTTPREWIASDETQLDALLSKLISRCKRVPDLIYNCRSGRPDPFPNWSV